MRPYFLYLAVSIFAIASIPASAQFDGEIVVTAPAGLKDAQKRELESIETDYQKYVSRLEKLRVEAADDVDDVAEANRNLQSAQKKLKSEQRDMDRTRKDIVKVERAIKKLEQRRAKLRAIAIRASDKE